LRKEGNKDQMSAAHKNEVARQKATERLDQTCKNLEKSAQALRDNSAKLMLHTSYSTKDHFNKTDQALQESAKNIQQVRKRLDFELKETSQKIRRTQDTIARTKDRLDSLREPLVNANSCATWRSQREARESIQDPVSAKLAEHQAALLASQHTLNQNAAEEMRVLRELEERHGQLTEDLRDKTAALHITLMCLSPPSHLGVGSQRPSPAKLKSAPNTPLRTPSSARGRTPASRMTLEKGMLGSGAGTPLHSARF
jgi:chromosome segregation ATPase